MRRPAAVAKRFFVLPARTLVAGSASTARTSATILTTLAVLALSGLGGRHEIHKVEDGGGDVILRNADKDGTGEHFLKRCAHGFGLDWTLEAAVGEHVGVAAAVGDFAGSTSGLADRIDELARVDAFEFLLALLLNLLVIRLEGLGPGEDLLNLGVVLLERAELGFHPTEFVFD